MTSVATVSRFEFDPPGPGCWTLDTVHFPRPVTRYWAEMHPEPFRRGTQEFGRFYGLLLDHIEHAYLDGFAYSQPVPVTDSDVPARLQRAAEVFERKLWREQLHDWDETFKPRAIRIHRELQAVDADALSDEELAAYVARCRDHHA